MNCRRLYSATLESYVCLLQSFTCEISSQSLYGFFFYSECTSVRVIVESDFDANGKWNTLLLCIIPTGFIKPSKRKQQPLLHIPCYRRRTPRPTEEYDKATSPEKDTEETFSRLASTSILAILVF